MFTREYFKKGFADWKHELFEYKYLITLSVVIVAIATFFDCLSGDYVSSREGTAVADLILLHIGPYNWGSLFVYGYLTLVFVLFLYPLVLHIRLMHIVVSQFSLLVMLRALFMIFTHLQTPVDAVPVEFPWIFQGLSFENDLFFSGHTAIPLLGFFLFKAYRIRYFFLAGSILMGVTVLVMHKHYSIDVFSAFFITYCSHNIGRFFLKRIDPTY